MVTSSLHDSLIRWVEGYRDRPLALRIFMPLSHAVPLDVAPFNYATSVKIRLINNGRFDTRSTLHEARFIASETFQHESLIDLFLCAVLRITDDELFASHIKEWQAFWSNLQIEADGDDELVKSQKFL